MHEQSEARRPTAYPKLPPEVEEKVVAAYKARRLRVHEIAELFGITRQTVYNIVRRSKRKAATRTGGQVATPDAGTSPAPMQGEDTAREGEAA